MIKLNPKNNPISWSDKATEIVDSQDKIELSEKDTTDFFLLVKKGGFAKIDYEQLLEFLSKLEFEDIAVFNQLKELSISLAKELSRDLTTKKLKEGKTEVMNVKINLPERFQPINKLLIETFDDQYEKAEEITRIVEIYLSKIDNILNDKDINELYVISSELIQKLSGYNFPQRKYIYKSLADILNGILSEYKFISPEDTNHIDMDIHKIIEGDSLRIKCGYSFVLINKSKNSVLEYGQVKTF